MDWTNTYPLLDSHLSPWFFLQYLQRIPLNRSQGASSMGSSSSSYVSAAGAGFDILFLNDFSGCVEKGIGYTDGWSEAIAVSIPME